MKRPVAQFYDEQRHRRLMPKQDLSDEEITDLIAFLDWVSKVDNQGWPPRPILVTGAPFPGTDFRRTGADGRRKAAGRRRRARGRSRQRREPDRAGRGGCSAPSRRLQRRVTRRRQA